MKRQLIAVIDRGLDACSNDHEHFYRNVSAIAVSIIVLIAAGVAFGPIFLHIVF